MRDLMLLGTAKQLQNYRGGGRGLAHGPPHGRLRPRLPTRPPVRSVAAPFGRGGTWLLRRRKKPVTPGCGRQRLCTRLGRAEDAGQPLRPTWASRDSDRRRRCLRGLRAELCGSRKGACKTEPSRALRGATQPPLIKVSLTVLRTFLLVGKERGFVRLCSFERRGI